MTLQRYNQIIFSILGTFALGACVVVLGGVSIDLLFSGGGRGGGGIIVGEAAIDPKPAQKDGGPEAVVTWCRPTMVPSTGLILVPAASGPATHSEIRGKMGSGSRGSSLHCDVTDAQNAVAVTADGGQHLVFDDRVLISSLKTPSEECVRGWGEVPCPLLLWTVKDADTDGDGQIGWDDADALFATDLQARNLRRLSPRGTHLLSSHRQGDRLLLRVQQNSDGNGRFDEVDSIEILQIGVGALDAVLPDGADPVVSPATPLLDSAVVRQVEELFG